LSTNPRPRRQAAAIPVRRKGDRLQVCLIRRRGSKSWGIPKGLVDRGDTSEQTALNEAWEEAGLKGRLIGKPLGTYEYEKWEMTLAVVVFAMHVLEESDDWEEASFRQRKWMSFREAASLLTKHPARPMLAGARSTALGRIR